jgi:hypothetical protein
MWINFTPHPQIRVIPNLPQWAAEVLRPLIKKLFICFIEHLSRYPQQTLPLIIIVRSF